MYIQQKHFDVYHSVYSAIIQVIEEHHFCPSDLIATKSAFLTPA